MFVITVAFYILGSFSGIFVKNINIKPPKKDDEEAKTKTKSESSEQGDLEGATATPSLSEAQKKEESTVEAKGETARAEGV